MKLLNRLFKSTLILIILIIGVGYTTNLEYPNSPKVKYQVDANYPPFTYSNQQFLYGFDIELTNIIFKMMDYQLVYSTDTWPKVYDRLVNGEIDLAGIIAVTEEREKEVLFSKPLFQSYVTVYTKKDFRNVKLNDLSSLRVGVGKGYYTEAILRNDFDITNYTAYDDLRDAIYDLLSGKIDVIFENQQIMDYLIVQEDALGTIEAQIKDLYPRPHAYAVSKDKPELVKYINQRIDELQKNGLFEETYVKYFYSHSSSYNELRMKKILFIVLIPIFAMLVLLFVLRGYISKLKVRLANKYENITEKNSDLSDANLELMQQYEEIQMQYEEINAQYEEIQLNNDIIYQMAYTDRLTNLPNRLSAADYLSGLIDEENEDRPFEAGVAIYLEIDHFRSINDTFGHDFGDQVLVYISKELKFRYENRGFVSRVGGDEFLVVMKGINAENDAIPIAEQLLNHFNRMCTIGDHEIYLSVSLGIVFLGSDCKTVLDVFKNTDASVYTAKQFGGSCYKFYEPEMIQDVLLRSQLEREIRQALNNEDFIVYYQPIYELEGSSLVGLEALIRWQKEDGSMVFPDTFIPFAEDSGLIVPLGEFVITEVCRQLKEWQLMDYKIVPVSINIAEKQLLSKNFNETLLHFLEHFDLEPDLIHLEITESHVMHNLDRNVRKLSKLQEMNFKILIDDFGTGYSSLSHLIHLPIDILKIDKSFVWHIDTMPKETLVISDIISIAHRMGKKVIAEGVETESQLAYLKSVGCDRVQGYLFSKPIPADAIFNN
ncbi:MAG: hypothetical protein BGO41_08140 [Clostridiales bacterium 38-18]|nr:MAG: hypothetical protein BGO41_08140 [Clostridiales bacterium 38-18]